MAGCIYSSFNSVLFMPNLSVDIISNKTCSTHYLLTYLILISCGSRRLGKLEAFIHIVGIVDICLRFGTDILIPQNRMKNLIT